MLPKEVDKIEIQVLVDFECDFGSTAPNFQYIPEIIRWKDCTEISQQVLCCAGAGFSYIIHLYCGDNKHTIMFDTGPSSLTTENSKKMGFSFKEVSDIVLSHRHFDHCGGLTACLDRIYEEKSRINEEKRGEMKEVNVFAHPGVFLKHGMVFPVDKRVIEMQRCASPTEVSKHHGTVVMTDKPHLIASDTVLISGAIPRVTSYEMGLDGQVLWQESTNEWSPEPLMLEEQFIVIRLKNHGIINVLRHTRDTLGIPKDEKIFLVMGGFHLIGPKNETLIPNTVSDILKFNPSFVCGGHCTGYKAKTALRNALGDNFHITPCGCSFVFPKQSQ